MIRQTLYALSYATVRSSFDFVGRHDRLERAGLIERRLNSGNRRDRQIALTPKGLSVIDDMIGRMVEMGTQMLSVPTSAEQVGLKTLLKKLLTGL